MQGHAPGQAAAPAAPCCTWVTGLDVVRQLLVCGSPVTGALLGVPALQLSALAGTRAHPAPLELFMVFYLQHQGRKERSERSCDSPAAPAPATAAAPAAPASSFASSRLVPFGHQGLSLSHLAPSPAVPGAAPTPSAPGHFLRPVCGTERRRFKCPVGGICNFFRHG